MTTQNCERCGSFVDYNKSSCRNCGLRVMFVSLDSYEVKE